MDSPSSSGALLVVREVARERYEAPQVFLGGGLVHAAPATYAAPDTGGAPGQRHRTVIVTRNRDPCETRPYRSDSMTEITAITLIARPSLEKHANQHEV
jgi:hypothetical protein